MKRILSLLLTLAMILSFVPTVVFAESVTQSVGATRAFSWNFDTNAQNGTLPTSVSWGNYRACFMSFNLPEEILGYKDKNAIIEATLSSNMTFNNGRKSGQVPVVTILPADGNVIDSVSLTGGAGTTDALKAAWEKGKVLCEFDTLNYDISPVMDITELVKNGDGKIGLYLTCRSEDGYLKTNGIVNFNSPVLNITAQEVNEDYFLNMIDIPYNLEDGYEMPKTVSGQAVSWSEDVIAAGAETTYKTVTASINGKTKDFDVMVMGKNEKFVLAYTTSESTVVGKSMHLAAKTESGWEALNFGGGVLFAKADLDDGTVAGTTRILEKPYIYRGEDGKINVAAVCKTTDGKEDDFFTIWETDNLVEFKEAGTAKSVEGYETTERVKADGFEGASCIFAVTDEEYDYLTRKLGEVKNTSVEEVVVRTNVGNSVSELPSLTAVYSDGSKAQVPVKWNENELNAINFNLPGVYTVTGQAVVSEYESPFAYGEADPVVYKYNDKYYFIATNETGGQVDLYIREGNTIEEAAAASEVLIFKHTSSGDHSGCNWAPELHVINGELYCLFASSTTGKWNAVQSRVMKCNGDPMNINDWEAPVRVTRKDGSYLIDEGITLDMTYFEAAGKHYYAWAERPITSQGNGNSYLAIAEMNPEDPYKLASDPVIICIPDYGWDRRTATVDEGPYVLKHDGKLYMSFSGSGCDNTYCLGLLTADEDADLLDASSWVKSNYPVFLSGQIDKELGPGHNSFIKDEYGRDVIVYHMKPDGGTRSATAKTIHYAFDGTPVFYMTPERYLKSEYRSVTATIYVRDDSMTDEEFEIESIANNFKIPNTDSIKGHITLPEVVDGASVTWTSDNKAVTKDGIVTRSGSDVKVNLTAVFTKNGASATRIFELTVKAKAEEKEKVGYIYAYFRGSVNGEKEVQQIHLAISEDGLNWRDLNGNFPVIESAMGTKGLRDPYIIRSYEGDKFYLMATDLDANGGSWSQYGNNGSKSLMFWESDDLVNWSEQRMIKVSNDDMGCTWAPEAIYDEETKQYVIFWSSSVLSNGGKKSVFYATTRDFVTFSEPKVFVDGSGDSTVIDTSMVRGDDGKYYRFTKREANNSIFMQVADSVLGEYTSVNSNITSITGVEGPAIFKMLDGRYCLMMDGYTGANTGVGFFPLVTDNLASGQFTRLTSGYKMPTGAKHGVMLAVTKEEYDAINEKWAPLPDDDTVLEYSFNEEDEKLTLYGNAKIENGTLVLDGTSGSYANLGNGIFDRRENFSVSMDIYNETESGFFFTFSIGDNNQEYLFLRTRKDKIRLAQTITTNTYEEAVDITVTDNMNRWNNYIITGDGETLKLYIDGVLAGEAKTTKTLYHLGNNLSVNLGKSTYSGDKYFKGKFDNIKIYNRTLTENDIVKLTGEEKLFNADVAGMTFVNPDETTADLMISEIGERSGCRIEWVSSNESVISNKGKVTRGDKDETVTMKATFTLGELSAEKEYTFKVLKKEEDYAYLFAYFTGNNASQERLFYGVSRDGYNFRTLNGGNSVLTSDLGTLCIRDPFIMKGEDGYYYIIATDMKSSLGWSSNYATVVYKTPDLINIVDSEWINYREIKGAEDCTRAWAPQAIWCPEKEAYMVYLAMSIPGDPYATVMYRHYATDLCDASTYTDVELMLDEPAGTNAGAIDGDIVYDKFHDEYIMYYDGKRVATSDKISGEWKHDVTKYSDGQLPMVTSGGVSMAVEGSNIWQIIGEDRWVIAADGSAFNGGCYALVETTDFENYTQLWEADGDYSFDFTPRHGYVIPISRRELNNLLEYYGEVEFPEEKEYNLNIDLGKKGVDISEDMYGIFYEDINYAADGGLYSEVIENRSFEAAHCNPDKGESYTKIPSSGWTVDGATAVYATENGLNENNPTYIRLITKEGSSLANVCYTGFNAKKNEMYNVSFFARGDYNGKAEVMIVDGEEILGKTSIEVNSEQFEKYTSEICVGKASDKATVKIVFDSKGTIEMDMISVMSQDTFNGRNNGLRKDIVQKLYDMHPAFMRFPGGCVVEGYSLENRYQWKNSIGPVEERIENWNRWQTGSNAYDYCQTLGLGFYEYFLLCEDIGAKPLPVVSVGIGCQYQAGDVSSWEDLYNIYIQDAIDLIEFANGDPETNEWAKIRAEMGHPEPFNLEYLGIGNEQWYSASNRFFERYEAFEEEIHKLYPEIKLISTSGPSADGTHYNNAWNWLETHNGEENFTYAVDEHYYKAPEWFFENINRYDKYDREGFSVFAGEYAANGTYGNTLYSAIAEAAYMTGLEKNADIVKMASYAPLLAKEGNNQWNPNLIWFNNSTVYPSSDYYVQKMYSENKGSYTVENKVSVPGEEKEYNAGAGTWATAAEFKDIRITNLETGEEASLDISKTHLGTWNENGGVVSQTDAGVNGAFAFNKTNCENYTLTLKARKTSGNEGFLIPVHYVDENNYIFWNIAGWTNTSHAVQRVVNGSKSTITENITGSVESNVWYDIEITIENNWMSCYLNGELIHKVNITYTEGPVYSTVSVDEASEDVIVKLVNSSSERALVNVDIANADYIAPEADEIILTGSSKDARNTADNPFNVAEEKGIFTGASDSFLYELGPMSFVVLRLHTKENYVTAAETVFAKDISELPDTVEVTLSNSDREERNVEWRLPTEGAYFYGGVYTIEGRIEGTNLYAQAKMVKPSDDSAEFIGDTHAVFNSEGAKGIVAYYKEDGEMISSNRYDVSGVKVVELEDNDCDAVRIMLWDENMKPLCEVKEIYVK
ncbi:MAG: family 43 glycosylhydrolase [Clostridia bacterium]|nr:family 43 glycosylhydrolase [Clostridia bacterium]